MNPNIRMAILNEQRAAALLYERARRYMNDGDALAGFSHKHVMQNAIACQERADTCATNARALLYLSQIEGR